MIKETIIDNVDVNECVYYKGKGKCRIPHFVYQIRYTGCNCENWNCDFKRRKLLEQKVKKLESKIYEIYNLSTNAFCLTHGTNKDMANFAKQILTLLEEE